MSNAEHRKPGAVVVWGSDDRKLLILSFLGTIIANIATIIIVALSIATARFMLSGKHSSPAIIAILVLTSLVAVMTAFSIPVFIRTIRKSQSSSIKRFMRIGIIASTIPITIGVVYFLALVGIAAGIK